MATVDILVPTYNRLEALIMTLSGIAAQTQRDLRVVVADQSDTPVTKSSVIHALQRVIEARGGMIEFHHRAPEHGIAEQRDFLLRQATAPYVLFVDDDVFMEPWVVAQLLATLTGEGCGFVGAFPVGMSYRHDVRPHQQRIDWWDGPVQPEIVEPGSPEWERWPLHCASNLYHVAQALALGEVRRYKVAWVGACGLYDRVKLLAVGGFAFWSRLPRYHSGEEVLVQNLLMRRWGGCAIIPSGTYHAEVPTTVLNAAGTVDGHALDLLPEMVARYAPSSLERKQ
ncbi:MAG: glycosyltransferase family 2 protein [Pseudomonadota bacterium]|nr:glycosyltransferase family 2 protein [Chloroflexota bacterium]MDP9414326.1 glycosyltransferase family 2 protein [Pseudomonadota bacterium]